jgi:hypothetical protein
MNTKLAEFPPQTVRVGEKAELCLNYRSDQVMSATIVRDDAAAPWVTILRTDDGRHFLASECQYRPKTWRP